MQFILHMATSALSSFHLPELAALADLLSLDLHIYPDLGVLNAQEDQPLLRISLPSVQQAQRLASRAMSIHSIGILLASGEGPSSLCALDPFPNIASTSAEETFRFEIKGILCSVSAVENKKTMRAMYDLIKPAGQVSLTSALHTYTAFVTPSHTFITESVATGQRALLTAFSLKTRSFIGNTSMSAEESLFVASFVHARPGALILDPFVGTGSLLYPCAHWGATVLGADIDGRQFRGAFGAHKADHSQFRIQENTAAYAQQSRWAGCIVQDLKNCDGFRSGIWDGIVADPPYGVRAGAKTVGRVRKTGSIDKPIPDGPLSPHLPSFRPYPLEELVLDLVMISHRLLVLGGRLTFFLPTTSEDFEIAQLPEMHGMSLMQGVAEQCFGKWTRRLITFKKTAHSLGINTNSTNASMSWTGFREKYFDGFKSQASETVDDE